MSNKVTIADITSRVASIVIMFCFATGCNTQSDNSSPRGIYVDGSPFVSTQSVFTTPSSVSNIVSSSMAGVTFSNVSSQLFFDVGNCTQIVFRMKRPDGIYTNFYLP